MTGDCPGEPSVRIANPFVRERLFPDTPVAGRNRKRLVERTGRMQVPYLVDPNTGEEMFESAHIVAYLERTYAI